MPAPPHTASGEPSSVSNTHGSGGEAANLRLDLGADRHRAGLGHRRSRGHRLALCRGWPLYAGGRAVRAHAEHLRARHDQGHGLPLHRHALPASLRGVRPACQPAVRHPLGQQCRPVRAGLSRGQAQRPLRRHDHRRFGRLLSRRQPESADPQLSRGGAQQELCEPQRQAVDGARRRRRRVEGAAAVHHVHALCQLSRCPGEPGRLQRALLFRAGRRQASRSAGFQFHGGQSSRRR